MLYLLYKKLLADKERVSNY